MFMYVMFPNCSFFFYCTALGELLVPPSSLNVFVVAFFPRSFSLSLSLSFSFLSFSVASCLFIAEILPPCSRFLLAAHASPRSTLPISPLPIHHFSQLPCDRLIRRASCLFSICPVYIYFFCYFSTFLYYFILFCSVTRCVCVCVREEGKDWGAGYVFPPFFSFLQMCS
uniref:Uncharacterized protein TCIL3000_4_3770 n=1 Tax=Trypanosoma congolense (strain IL3000) TaxID=1068625 RepID=G0ULL8_TRYCI|nr:unnamed protein product [Trypanosoma congolense IL3000]